MVAIFGAVRMVWPRLQVSLVLILTCLVTVLVAGLGEPLRHLVEGEFGFFYVILVIFTGMLFLRVLQASGVFDAITQDLILTLAGHPVLLLFLLTVLLWFPGMITGLGTAAVLSAGALVAPILLRLGIPPANAAAIVALEATFGTITGPVNIPAMIVAGGINMPYEGFGLVLPLITVPLGLFTVLYLGLRHARKAVAADLTQGLRRDDGDPRGLVTYLPLIVVVGLMVVIRTLPKAFPDLSTPLVFMIGSLVGTFTGRRVDFFKVSREALGGPVFPVVGLLMAVGMVVQVATVTGVKGLLVISSLSLPMALLYLGMAVSLPLLGGVLTHLGAAAVLGVPFVLALLGRNVIVTTASVSLLCALSQLVPPTAVAGYLSAQVVGLESFGSLVRRSAVPALVTTGYCLAVIFFANDVARLLSL